MNSPPRRQIRLRDYRYPGEIWSLVLTFLSIVGLYFLAIWFFPAAHTQIWKILIVTVAALAVYIVTVLVQQRSVFGTMVRVSPRQFRDLYDLAATAAERLSSDAVPVYVRRSSEQLIYTLGFLSQPLIVITSAMVDQMPKDCLQFFIAREVGHIQAGHTWLRTLLKPVGSEVPIIGKLLNSVIFGDWINRAEFTADRAGFIGSGSLTSSVTGMLRYGVGNSLYEQMDIHEFLGQINDVRNIGGIVTDIIADQPYLTERVRRLVRFAVSEDFQRTTQDEPRPQTQILSALPQAYIRTGQLDAEPVRHTSPLSASGTKSEPGPRIVIDLPPETVNGANAPAPAAINDKDLPVRKPVSAPVVTRPAVGQDENAPDPQTLLLAADTQLPHILRRRLTRLGRNPDNDIVVDNDRVSRYHAEIVRQDNEFTVVDKQSRNGIWLNGSRIDASAPLKNGDRLRIGRQEFLFTIKQPH
jgi:Zn-dependent protease with chaperone function